MEARSKRAVIFALQRLGLRATHLKESLISRPALLQGLFLQAVRRALPGAAKLNRTHAMCGCVP